MSTAQLVDHDEFPARTALKGAQERLAAALAAAEASAQSLARGRETLGELEKRRDAAHAEVANEARARAEAVEQGGVCAVIGGAAQKRREIDDELSSFEISVDILLKKSSDAQRAIGECEAALAAAVKGVVGEVVSPLLCRMQDCERAASQLKSQLRALQYSGRWGLCPENLPRQLLREPVNVFHSDRPLSWDQQKVFDRRKAAWCDFADRLREDADATLSLGD
jgi:DNA repair exonuclease SbcCD ATPase subunit